MSTLPLGARPSVTWHPNPTNTHFGAPRGGGFPVHGACDLVAPAGTKVLAVQDGRIIRGPYEFITYCEGTKHQTTTYAIDVAHEHFTLRYGEISNALAKGLHAGSTVSEGQVIAFVGMQCNGTMLILKCSTTRAASTISPIVPTNSIYSAPRQLPATRRLVGSNMAIGPLVLRNAGHVVAAPAGPFHN